MEPHLRDVEDEHAWHGRGNDHKDSQSIGGVNEVVHGQYEAEGSPDAHQDDHDIHGDADKARVVDVVVLDIATLVGQEQAEHNQ